jgi:hypothetical protein
MALVAPAGPAVLNLIATAREQGSQALVQLYDAELQDPVLEFGRSVLSAPSLAGAERWLRLFTNLSGLSLEGPADLTVRLRDKDAAVFGQALSNLDEADRSIVGDFLRSLDDPDLDIAAFQSAPSGPSIASSGVGPVLAKFVVSRSFDGSRRRVWAGRLTVFDRQGRTVGDYSAQTGGFVADYRRKYGPTPPGTYRVDHHRRNRFGAPGMERDGVAYSFDLKEVDGTVVFNRDAFRIHPDQNPPGTHGCIGVAEARDRLRHCETKLAEALEGGAFRLTVAYGPPAVA